MTVLAVDPGKRKCGLAVVSRSQGVIQREVVATEELIERVRQWTQQHSVDTVLVGGSTGSKEVVGRLKNELEIKPTIVDERHTTERARYRYFQDHPPRGFWRLVPLGLQIPPGPYDDYAAVVMAEEFLEKPVAKE
ncbi:MAG: Holliday junction resolvase RuvX [Vulcanimicrobiota bacterium]